MFEILKKVSFRETKVVSRFALVSFCETKVVSSSNLAKFGGFFFLCLGFKAQKKLFFGPNSPYAGFQRKQRHFLMPQKRLHPPHHAHAHSNNRHGSWEVEKYKPTT